MNKNNMSNYYAILPMMLLCDERYKNLSPRAIQLYALMQSRSNLSAKNKHRFSDEKGVFIYFTQTEMCECLKCCRETASSTIGELISAGLVTREAYPKGKSPKYYVKPVQLHQANSVNVINPYVYEQQKEVSFSVTTAEKQSRDNRNNFSIKKNSRKKKTENI